MDLLDRYLQAVKKHLPAPRRDDIIAELRANLEAQLEEKEAALGRPLNAVEAEQWIRQLGAPMQMAAQYQPQRYLIGPGLFPTYLHVLKLAFFCAMLVYAIVSAVELVAGNGATGEAVAGILLRVPGILMTTAAWVTVVFAALEFAAARYSAKFLEFAAAPPTWEPASLPPVESDLPAGMRRRTFSNAAAEAVFGWIALVWLMLIPQHPFLLFGPGAAFLHGAPFQLAGVWTTFYWWIVGLTAVNAVWRAVELWRGTWERPRPVYEVAFRLAGVVPVALLLAVPDHIWVTLGPGVNAAQYAEVLGVINRSIYWTVVGIVVLTVVQAVGTLGRMVMDGSRRRVSVMI